MRSAVTPRCVCVCVFGSEAAERQQQEGFPIVRVNYRTNRPKEPRITARPAAGMSEEAVRQTRSQKRALEREAVPAGSKRSRSRPASSFLSAGEVKATIKLELQTRDQNMSAANKEMKRECRSPSPDDVIVLSDEAPSPRVKGRSRAERHTDVLMRSCAVERMRVIKQLKEELRLEEAKLILLKKIRHSQINNDSSGQKPALSVSAVLPPLVKNSIPASAAQPQVVCGRASGTVIPPPLVRGGHTSKPGSASAPSIMPPLVRGAQTLSVSPQQMSGLRQQNSSAPPPLLLASSVPAHKILQSGLVRVGSIPSASLLVINQAAGANLKSLSASESPASRQAAAKLALRKQLEKALLEIPAPTPPAPQLRFLPSAANNEFIYLLGLEEVVQSLLESLGRGKQGPYAGLLVRTGEPSRCRQCQTDFTCRWRRDGGGATVCEQCMSSNQKKALKAEHTGRLKAAFLKALQQEQEMERRVLQQATPPPSSSSEPGTRRPQAMAQVSPSPRQQLAHAFPPSSQLQNAVAAAALVSRPGVTMAYVNSSLSGQRKLAERHRKSLLHTLPRRSDTQAPNIWK